MKDKYGFRYDEYAEYFGRKVMPELRSSNVFVMFLPDSLNTIDVKICTELGAAVLLEKTVVVVMAPGVVVPEKLCRLVDQFIEVDMKNPVESKRLLRMLADLGFDPRRN